MNGTQKVSSDDTSRFSLTIGAIIAVVLIAVVSYLVYAAHATTKGVTGFDPNRPVPSDEVLRKRLKPDQFHITRENGTEMAFQNEYWNNERVGLYVDVITGEPLFTSLDKFDGATGRPTFAKPISKDLLVEKIDTSHDMQRTEVSARRSNAHLGHLFPDPASPSGQRYVLNSAALRFIPVERMQEAGYREFRPLLEKK